MNVMLQRGQDVKLRLDGACLRHSDGVDHSGDAGMVVGIYRNNSVSRIDMSDHVVFVYVACKHGPSFSSLFAFGELELA